MKRPASVTKYMKEFEETEKDVKEYILRQLEFFPRIPSPGTDEAGWVAFKMGCSIQGAESAIKWAKGEQ